MMAATVTTTSKGKYQPEREHGRPEKENFGDAHLEGGLKQLGFSSHC